MPVADALRRLTPDTPPEYECGVCAATYGREPPNCHSCGSTEFRER